MPDMLILALTAGGAALALGGLIASRRRRKRQRAPEVGELPTFLYLASHTQDSSPGVPARSSTRDTPEWAPRSAGAARGAAVGWGPAADDTVQLLPGRLEPLPESAGQEIRFVRRPGVTRFTFGRSRGAAFEHIQLRVATASRMHAFMEFEDGRWRIGCLSETNAVVVNGAPVMPGTVQTLEDGDRIEMGEAAFTFRQPGLRAEIRDGVA